MNGESHRLITSTALFMMRNMEKNPLSYSFNSVISEASERTDKLEDLEFVNVKGGKDIFWGIFGNSRDDPHKDNWDAVDDEAHKKEGGKVLTAFNHFIDIRKGSGYFDDYDGYSYEKGSACKNEYQDASETVDGFWEELLAEVLDKKVDEGIAYWFNDEYVHAPGHEWYRRDCSPSLERYSFPHSKGTFNSVEAECKERFPLADSTGGDGKGFPYSVFMPIDNLAKYWYLYFLDSYSSQNEKALEALGHVMHAIQDASVPHHAAGYMGNWHSEYENDLQNKIKIWLKDSLFLEEINTLLLQWKETDPYPPKHLKIDDWKKVPAINWDIDQLVTWIALNSYKEYDQVYLGFKNGYHFDENSAKYLTKLAIAMSTWILRKAIRSISPKYSSEFPSSPKWIQTSCSNSNAPAVFQNRALGSNWHYEVIVREEDHLQHYWFCYEHNQWYKAECFGSNVKSEPIVFQNLADGDDNYEVIVWEGDYLQHYSFLYRENKWCKRERFGSNIQSQPSVFQNEAPKSKYNYELVVREGNQLQHYWFSYKEKKWNKGMSFGYDIQSRPVIFQNRANNNDCYNYEVVVHEGSYLQHYWFSYLGDRTWHKADAFGSNVCSEPVMLQNYVNSHYEVIVQEGKYLQHYRFALGTDWKWHRGERFGNLLCSPADLTIFQNYAPNNKNFEVVVREGNCLQHYWFWHDGDWKWHKAEQFGSNIQGAPVMFQNSALNNYNYEVIVKENCSLQHYWFWYRGDGKWHKAQILK